MNIEEGRNNPIGGVRIWWEKDAKKSYEGVTNDEDVRRPDDAGRKVILSGGDERRTGRDTS